MIFANNANGEKIEATPNATGFCPSCEELLLAKCGRLRIHHWSHMGRLDCDDWHEPETAWHLGWKRLFGKDNCEVVMPPHRADILGTGGVIIELQHSSIQIREIKEREKLYGERMIWIVDAEPFTENLAFMRSQDMSRSFGAGSDETWIHGGSHYLDEVLLKWKRKQKRWLPMYGAERPVMLDISGYRIPSVPEQSADSLFWMKRYYYESDLDQDCYLIGGNFVTKQRMLDRYKPKVESQNLPAQNGVRG